MRIWSVPERRVLDVADVHEMVTSAAWVPPGGARAAVATLKGKVRYYSVDEHGRLEYEAQVGEGLPPPNPRSPPSLLCAVQAPVGDRLSVYLPHRATLGRWRRRWWQGAPARRAHWP